MTQGKVTIIGINGHIGHAVARAMLADGWTVTGFGRSNRHPIPGVGFIKGDADNVADIAAAVADADVVFNGLNLPYPDWFDGRAEALLGRVIAAMGLSGKTMLFPGNIYNYAANDAVVTPDLVQRPQTPRGEIRVRMEKMLRAAADRGDIRAIVLRAGDFYGPGTTGDWFDLVMLREASKGKFAMMGARGVAHAWAYLPNLGRAFSALAQRRSTFAPYDTFHFAGHYVTPEQMADAAVAAAPVPLRVSMFPRVLFRVAGLFDPLMREVGRMGYLWEHPMRLSDPRLDAILGSDFATPFGDAVAETVRPFFARARLAA